MSRTVAALAILTAAMIVVPAQASVLQTTEATTSPNRSDIPASAEERAAYDRLDALSRSLFWSHQFEINATDPVAGVKAALALRELGRYEQAADTAQRTLIVQPDNTEAMLELGRAQIARGQAFYGIASLEQAMALSPNDWRPLSLLGVAYQQVERTSEARDIWNRGLTMSPDNPEILTNVAVALTATGDTAGAETLLRRAVAQPQATLKMRQNLALVLGLQGKTGEAEQIIRRDLPPEMARTNLAWLAGSATPPPQNTTGADPSARTWRSLQSQ